MKKKIYLVLLTAAVVAVFLVSSPQSVSAISLDPPSPSPLPAAGSWSWDNEDVTGTVVPQYQLASTYDPDYAVLQSAGIHLSGATQLCHPYRGGQFGWNAEIRVKTSTGWQPVPTVNEWVPDEEGQFMTCANVWSSGTYAVFGYWEKFAGWQRCPVPGFSTFYFRFAGDVIYYGGYYGIYLASGCDGNGGFISEPPMDPREAAYYKATYYCCNDTIYLADGLFFEQPLP